MQLLNENEYVLQFGLAKKTNFRVARFLVILAALVFLVLIFDYVDIIQMDLDIFGKTIRKLMIFEFLKTDSQILMMMMVYLLILFSIGFVIGQIVANKRRNIVITTHRFFLKRGGQKMTTINIKDIDHVNLLSGKHIEFVKGQELFRVNKIERADRIFLLAEWYVAAAKTPR